MSFLFYGYSGTTFLPSQLSAVQYWLDAGTITGVADGGTIAAADLVDQSSYARGALTAATACTYRADAGNGKPAIEFNGSTSYAKSPSFVLPQRLWVFLVLKPLGGLEGPRFYDGNTVNKAILYNGGLPASGGWSFKQYAITAGLADYTPDLNLICLASSKYDGVSSTLQVNGNQVSTASGGTNGYTDGMTLGAAGNFAAGFFANYQFLEMVVANSTLTDAQAEQIQAYLTAKHSIITRGNVVCDGNSLTAGVGATGGQSYPTQLLALIGGNARYRLLNKGVSGQTTPQMTADAATDIDPQARDFLQPFCVAWEITNDIVVNGANGTTAYNNFVTYCTGRQAAGFTVIALTVLDRVDFTSTMRGYRNDANTSLRANWATFSSALVDVAAIPELSDYTNTTYFTDGVHLTNAGYALVADAVYDALVSL